MGRAVEKPVQVRTARDMAAEVDSMRKLFKDGQGEDWEKRVRALRKCRTLATVAAESSDEELATVFVAGLRTLKGVLAAQVSDLRSALVREACECLAQVAECLGDVFGESVGDTVIPALLKTSAITIQVVSESGADAMRRILNSSRIPPSVILSLTSYAAAKNSVATRMAVAEYAGIILDRHPRSELDRVVGGLQNAVQVGLRDAHPEIRRRSRKNFCIFEMMYAERAGAMLSEMDSAAQKAVEQERSEGDLAPRTRSNARRATVAPTPAERSSGPPRRTAERGEEAAAGAPSARAVHTASRAQRVTSTTGRGAAGDNGSGVQSPFRPGRVAVAAGGDQVAPKQLRDWSARVHAIEALLARTRVSDFASVEHALRATSDCIADAHVRVSAAALAAVCELIRGGGQAPAALEKNFVVLVRVLTKKHSPNKQIRDSVAATLRSLEERTSAEAQFSLFLRMLSASVAGKFGAEHGGEKLTATMLECMADCLVRADGDSFEWRVSLLEGSAQVLAPLARARTAGVRGAAAAVLVQIHRLAPEGALRLAADTLEAVNRQTVYEVARIAPVARAAPRPDAAVDSARAEPAPAAPVVSADSAAAAHSSEMSVVDEAPSAVDTELEPLDKDQPASQSAGSHDHQDTPSERKQTAGSDKRTTRLKALIEVAATANERDATAAWEELGRAVNASGTVSDKGELMLLCREGLNVTSRFPRGSEATIAAELAVLELGRSFAPASLVAESLLSLLGSGQLSSSDARRLTLLGAKVALERASDEESRGLGDAHAVHIARLSRDGRGDVRLAAIDFLAVLRLRMGPHFPTDALEELGPARQRILERRVERCG